LKDEYKNSEIIRRVIRLLRPWRKYILLSNILSVFASLFTVFSIVAAFPLLELVFNPDSDSNKNPNDELIVENRAVDDTNNTSWYESTKEEISTNIEKAKTDLSTWLRNDPIYSLYILILVIVGATLVRIGLLTLVNLIISRVETKFIQKITYDLYVHIIYHDRVFFSFFPLGKLLARISMDIFKLRTLIELVYVSKIQYPVQIFVLFVALFVVSYKLAFFSMLFFPLIVLPAVYLSKMVKKLAVREVGFDAGFMEVVEEQFSGQMLIKSMKGEETERRRFELLAEENFERRKKRSFLTSMSQPLQDLLTTISVALIIIMGVYLVFDKSIVSGEVFLYFLLLLASLYATIKKLLDLNVKIQKPLISAGAIFKTLDEPHTMRSNGQSHPYPENWGSILVQGLWFKYSKSEKRPWVLQDINMKITHGETILLYGRNGSGKSTLAALLASFYRPSKGGIYMDETPVLEIDFEMYRKELGYIHQDTIIFNLSVAQNIAFGVPEEKIDYVRIDNIIEEIGMNEFIDNLPEGVNTICGLRGSKLSGGQRQLLAFCRAMYFNYSILIVDEPTSNLDDVVENQVINILQKMKTEKTIILISHNKRLHHLADRRFSLERGHLVEVEINSNIL